jgi:hypothetical protein
MPCSVCQKFGQSLLAVASDGRKLSEFRHEPVSPHSDPHFLSGTAAVARLDIRGTISDFFAGFLTDLADERCPAVTLRAGDRLFFQLSFECHRQECESVIVRRPDSL